MLVTAVVRDWAMRWAASALIAFLAFAVADEYVFESDGNMYQQVGPPSHEELVHGVIDELNDMISNGVLASPEAARELILHVLPTDDPMKWTQFPYENDLWGTADLDLENLLQVFCISRCPSLYLIGFC